MISIFTGLPGAGKSLKMADTIIEVLYRNKKWYEKEQKRYQEFPEQFIPEGQLVPIPPTMRKVYSNLRLNKEVESEFRGFIYYWVDPSELVKIRDADVFWDEIATHLDSTQWQNMSLEIKRWLQQHRKLGLEIYGTTQDFAMIDKSMRRMTSHLTHFRKLFGSRDKSATSPIVKRIFGLSMGKSLDPTTYEEDNKVSTGFPSFLWITRRGIDLYDTTQEIQQGKYPPLNHIERECIVKGCSFHKIIHA